NRARDAVPHCQRDDACRYARGDACGAADHVLDADKDVEPERKPEGQQRQIGDCRRDAVEGAAVLPALDNAVIEARRDHQRDRMHRGEGGGILPRNTQERRYGMGAMIEFARPDGGKTKGYLATAGQGRPGIVVIQEWWGLNDQICGVADRFARAGYNALAPDLYKGRLTAVPDEANHLMSNLNFPDATHQDLRGAAQHLKATSGKVTLMGFF